MEFITEGTSTLSKVVIGIGVALGTWGFLNLLEGYGSDNPGAKSQGIKQFVAGGGIILVGYKLIPLFGKLFG